MEIMRRVTREITEEQWQKHEKGESTGIWTQSELLGYGVYGEEFYQKDGKYYVDFQMGTSCD